MDTTLPLIGAIVAPLLLTACSGGESASGATSGTGGATSASSGSSTSSGSATWPKDPATGLRVPELGPVPPLPEWADNPATEAKKELGKALFFDGRNSGSGTASCTGCHLPVSDFQSGLQRDLPDRSYPAVTPPLPRHTPSLLNIMYAPILRWDGSYYKNLYETMALPFAEANMNLTPGIPSAEVETVDIALAQKTLFKKLTVDAPGYVAAFQNAFGQDITTLKPEEVWLLTGKALAAYIRVAVSRDAPFDKWNAGDDSAMSEAAIHGLTVFRGKALCIACHGGPLFSDFKFHNVSTSLPNTTGHRPDEGRYNVTNKEEDRGAFLTPTLRSASKTSPYFHDGSRTSLFSVIRHLTTEEGRADPLHDPIINGAQPLTDGELSDLVTFIKALSGAELPLATLGPPAKLP
jgi:cytochrome c peroxidase